MFERLPDILALINDVLQASVVIFGSAVVLYNLRHSRRDRVTRAFSALLIFVAIVYLTELMVSRTQVIVSAEPWLRFGWIGITLVPAALFHLADALLTTTGNISRPRRLFVRVWYLTGVAFLALVIFTNLIVGDLVPVERAPHLRAGPLFVLFTLYFWAITATSIYYVWRARQRSITSTTRQRMTRILIAFLGAPVAVFPYLLVSGNPNLQISIPFWLVLIGGNIIIGIMFSFLTYYLAYFGAASPDRVVRVRLFKFMARVPMTAFIVLVVYVLVNRAGSLLGLHVETALAVAVVATVMLVEWAIHVFKRPLERLFQLNDDPDVRRIQELGERLLTTRDLHQFLESLLVATCETLRTPVAFIAAITPEGPRLEVAVGPLAEPEAMWSDGNWQALAQPSGNGDGQPATIERAGRFFLWQNYWIRRLYDPDNDNLLGILGIKARAATPDLTPNEKLLFERVVNQAEAALKDRILQQEVFAAVEGLLPQVTALQLRRSAAVSGGIPALTASEESTVVDDPEFTNMVWDALSHYWGGPKLTESPLMRLQIVQRAVNEHGGNPTKALREILERAVEQQKPPGERSMTTAEWILYNILELKFIQGRRVRDVARRLAMSESDLYRKQRVAIENVARTISTMERAAAGNGDQGQVVESTAEG